MSDVSLTRLVPLQPGEVSELDAISRWDVNAGTRNLELVDNGDPSYRALKNLIFESLFSAGVGRGDHILDVGCGLGYLSDDLTAWGFKVDGIDPSVASIEIARQAHGAHGGDLSFYAMSLQEYALRNLDLRYRAIVANMTLHNVADLQGFMFAAESLLEPAGVIVATIPNPRNYLQSRLDLDVSHIDLRVEQTLEIPFRIRDHEPHPARVLFHHRPIRLYSVSADNASIPLRESRVPEHVGPGRPRDVTVLEFDRSTRT